MATQSFVDVTFYGMAESELQEWVMNNPGAVNSLDRAREPPLFVAIAVLESVSLVLWLVQKGANVNAAYRDGRHPFHFSQSPQMYDVLMGCGADPSLPDESGNTPLMSQVKSEDIEAVTRLLRDPRVHAGVNHANQAGNTALHFACIQRTGDKLAVMLPLLLRAGADPNLKNARGASALCWLEGRYPFHPVTLGLQDKMLDPERAAFLIMIRRFVMATTSNNATAPSFLQGRVARGKPLPRVELSPVEESVVVPYSFSDPTDFLKDKDEDEEDEEDKREFRTMLAFLVGLEGGGMPRDVFRVVLDFLIPFWDPLRRTASRGQQPQSG